MDDGWNNDRWVDGIWEWVMQVEIIENQWNMAIILMIWSINATNNATNTQNMLNLPTTPDSWIIADLPIISQIHKIIARSLNPKSICKSPENSKSSQITIEQ